MTGFWVDSQPEDRLLSTSSAAVNSVSDRTDLLAVLKPWEPQSRGWGWGWHQEAELYLMKLRFTHSLRMCVFLEQRNSDKRSPEWISHWKYFTMFFKEGKQNILSPLKMSERKEKSQTLLVKCRKSYYVWTLVSDACLERGDWDFGLRLSFFLSLSLSIKWNEGEEAGASGEM